MESAGAERGSVTAAFQLAPSHLVFAILDAQGVSVEGNELIIRRVQGAEGPSRVFINDQPVSLSFLRQIAGLLVEIHGQHADRALVDVAAHRRLIDAYGGLEVQVADLGLLWQARQKAEEALAAHQALIERAELERDYITHAVAELQSLDPQENEEATLAEERQLMMHAEQFSAALREAESVLTGDGFEARLSVALRKLERKREQAQGRFDVVCAALDKVLVEMNEANRNLDEAARNFVLDPKLLEKSEERLFALRAAARKYKCQVEGLVPLRLKFEAELADILDGGHKLEKLEAAYEAADEAYHKFALTLSMNRKKTARALDKAVLAELPPLKLERAMFETHITSDAGKPSASGIDRVEFLVAANPGTALQPLMKVASGGELARFMLALKVILATKGSAPTLIFDEIDTGVGGAVADAIGARLARMAEGLQVLAVTHSPQVAARARSHFLIAKKLKAGASKTDKGPTVITEVQPLAPDTRREEIARMLSGAEVTPEARAQADKLLAPNEV